MSVFEWRGPEETLGTAYTATALIVEKFDSEKGTAVGMISTYDYVEGCDGEHKWEAQRDDDRWIVKPVDSFWKDKNTGEQFFTLIRTIDKAMETFIEKKLIELERFDCVGFSIVEDRKKFQGEMRTYEGQCVCDLLETANTTKPFPWAALTQSKFPERCFKCSCGVKWWCGNPDKGLWIRVGDDAAWSMLTEHNGVDVEPITIHPQKVELYLLKTVRREGFIPIG